MTKIEKSRYHVKFSFLLLVSCQLYAMNPTKFLIASINQSNQQLKIGDSLWFQTHNPHWRWIERQDDSWKFSVKSAPALNFELKKTAYQLTQIHQTKSILLKEYTLLGIDIKDSNLTTNQKNNRSIAILQLNLFNRSTQQEFIQLLIEFKKKDHLYSLNCYLNLEKTCHDLIELIQVEQP